MIKTVKLGKSLNPSMKSVMNYLNINEGDLVMITENHDGKFHIFKTDEEGRGYYLSRPSFTKKVNMGKSLDISMTALLEYMGAVEGDYLVIDFKDKLCEISISKDEENIISKKLGYSLDFSTSSLLDKVGIDEGDFVWIKPFFLNEESKFPCGFQIVKLPDDTPDSMLKNKSVKKVGKSKQINLSSFFKRLLVLPEDEVEIRLSKSVITILPKKLYDHMVKLESNGKKF
ncbi:hypothetical protein [Methanococcus maripaludis]|uniref:Uncharacterized protein n=1 Tax=Methanococcus maripaludis TaxID=39152 RepID=A0A2L1C8D3_METMI|nr:hypothetical protein [Methanococcus maripaludis]AVB75638.1 hypothetical protein MMJJ_02190 [Methanococcus maripaludis]